MATEGKNWPNRLKELAEEFLVDDVLIVGDRVVLRRDYELNGGTDLPPGTIGRITKIDGEFITVETAKRSGSGLVRNTWSRTFWRKDWKR